MGMTLKREIGLFTKLSSLKERMDVHAKDLPYGEQRLLEIAIGPATDLELLLLDEPVAGMNPNEGEQVMSLISEIRTRGITVLLVEQNAFLALQMSNRTYVLEVGQVTLVGNSRDLIQNEHVRKAYLGKRVSDKRISNYRFMKWIINGTKEYSVSGERYRHSVFIY